MISTAISCKAAVDGAIFWLAVGIGVMFLFVWGMPFCRRHENLWLFLLTAINSIPINIHLTGLVLEMDILYMDVPILGPVTAAISAYLILLALEELAVGVVGRMVWNQIFKDKRK